MHLLWRRCLVVFAAVATAACSSNPAPSSSLAAPATPTTAAQTTATQTTATQTTAAIATTACRFEPPAGYEVRCSDLVVPQDRSKLGGTKLALHVAVFHLLGAVVEPDPVLYLEGGPGGHALRGAEFAFSARFANIAHTRDVVIFDQRGTGFSVPALECVELTELFRTQMGERLPGATTQHEQRGALARCFELWQSKGYDLASFNSIESAADIADLRGALGVQSWNLLGVSYGTRLALTALRLQPAGVRSVVLDSTYPPEVDATAEFADRAWAAMTHFFKACDADTTCRQNSPGLAARFWALVRQLDATPLSFEATDPIAEIRHDVIFGGDSLIGLLFQALYSPSWFTAMPRVVAELEKGNVATTAVLVGAGLAQLGFLSIGAHVAVQCREELAFSDPVAVAGATQRRPELAGFINEQLLDGPAGPQTCALSATGSAPSEEAAAVLTTAPMLVLAGEFDPVTPSAWGEAVAARNPNASFALFPGLGQGVSLGQGCPNDVVLAFLDQPNKPPDMSCRATMASPVWIS